MYNKCSLIKLLRNNVKWCHNDVITFYFSLRRSRPCIILNIMRWQLWTPTEKSLEPNWTTLHQCNESLQMNYLIWPHLTSTTSIINWTAVDAYFSRVCEFNVWLINEDIRDWKEFIITDYPHRLLWSVGWSGLSRLGRTCGVFMPWRCWKGRTIRITPRIKVNTEDYLLW